MTFGEKGILLIDKPSGITSFGVVARIRRLISNELQKKKVKVGHTGTLDPFATGLMVLLYGKETKNAMKMTKLDKEYLAEIVLGKVSTTGDPDGEISDVDFSKIPSIDDVRDACRKFTGKITQTPPVFSAIKINGRRAYDLARKGEDFEVPKREVNIFEIEILEYDFPALKIRAKVSSGTYIRSLAEDIGNYLGVGAYCLKLRRTKVGDFSIENAKTLEDFGIEN